MATNYLVTTDVNGSFTIVAGSIDTTQTSLNLIGQGAAGYGQAFAENTIAQLSNFAGPTQPAHPLKGQLWYNSTSSILQVYTGNQNNPWDSVGNTAAAQLFVARTDFYENGGTGPNSIYLLKSEAATTYVKVSDLGGGGGGTVVVSATNGGTGLSVANSNPLDFIRVKSDKSGYEFVSAADIANAASGAVLTGANSEPTVDLQWTIGTPSKRFNAIWAGTFNGTATSAQYADLAERYSAVDDSLTPGDVVELSEDDTTTGEVQRSTSEKSHKVFGVVSTAPGMKLNSSLGDGSAKQETEYPYIALTGRVPVKVVGPVKKGQYLVSSVNPGVARAADVSEFVSALDVLAIIGRALESKTSHNLGMVEISIGGK